MAPTRTHRITHKLIASTAGLYWAGGGLNEEIMSKTLKQAARQALEALRIAREHIQIDRNSFKEAHSFPDGFIEREDQATLKRLDQKLAVIDAAIAKAEGGTK